MKPTKKENILKMLTGFSTVTVEDFAEYFDLDPDLAELYYALAERDGLIRYDGVVLRDSVGRRVVNNTVIKEG